MNNNGYKRVIPQAAYRYLLCRSHGWQKHDILERHERDNGKAIDVRLRVRCQICGKEHLHEYELQKSRDANPPPRQRSDTEIINAALSSLHYAQKAAARELQARFAPIEDADLLHPNGDTYESD